MIGTYGMSETLGPLAYRARKAAIVSWDQAFGNPNAKPKSGRE